jgi:hypothetical protein
MDAAAETAVDAGDDFFLADDFSESDDAIGDQFRALDDSWCVQTRRTEIETA